MSKKDTEIKSTKIAEPKNIVVEYFESFVVTLIMALFGMTFIIQAVTVPTGSMQNTILIGDYLLVNKFIFAPSGNPIPFLPQRKIKRGDIIVFKYPGNKVNPESDQNYTPPLVPYQINYVKRVIGLPGETVEFRDNHVYINGNLLPEHRIIGDSYNRSAALITKEFEEKSSDSKHSVYYSESTMTKTEAGEKLKIDDYEFGVAGKTMKIPEDSYFVMGDSRDQSSDSRVWGFVPRELIIGQAMFVYWSCDQGAGDGGLGTCLKHPRLDRIGTMIK